MHRVRAETLERINEHLDSLNEGQVKAYFRNVRTQDLVEIGIALDRMAKDLAELLRSSCDI